MAFYPLPYKVIHNHTFRNLAFLSIFILAGLSVLFESWITMAAGILCLGGIIFLYQRFEWGIFLLVFIAPITRFPGYFQYVEKVKLWIYVGVLLMWLVSGVLLKNKPAQAAKAINPHPFGLFLKLFCFLLIGTALSSVNIDTTLYHSCIHVIHFLYFLLFLEIFQHYLKRIHNVVFLFILMGGMVSVIGILQYLSVQFNVLEILNPLILPAIHRNYLLQEPERLFILGGYRSWGTFHHPNLLGIYLAMICPIAFCFAMCMRKRFKRVLFIFSGLLMIGGILCSGSRGALVNIAVSSAFLLFFYRKFIPKSLVLSIVAMAAGIFLIFSSEVKDFLRIEGGLSSRQIIWNNALQLFSQNPFFGIGLGNFSQEYLDHFGFPSVVDLEITLDQVVFQGNLDALIGSNAHNLFLNYGTEMGIGAVLLILYFYFVYFREFYFFIRHTRHRLSFGSFLVIGSAASIAGNFVHSFFEASTNFNYLPTGIPFLLIAGMSLALMLRRKIYVF